LLQTKKFNHFDVTCSSPWVTRQARNDQWVHHVDFVWQQ
jgi:hypothetical protein